MAEQLEAEGIAIERNGADRPGATPIVLVHGVGTNRTIWTRSLPILAEARDGSGMSPAETGRDGLNPARA